MRLVEARKMKDAFQNLFNMYAHELSKYNPWLGTQIDKNGNYLAHVVKSYIEDQFNQSFCIIEDRRPIGLVVFSSSCEEGEWQHDIEEIFIIQTSRKKGVSEKICQDFWQSNKGVATLCVLKAHKEASAYWEKLITRYNYTYEKIDEDEKMWLYKFNI